MVGKRLVYGCVFFFLVTAVAGLRFGLFDKEFSLPDDNVAFRAPPPVNADRHFENPARHPAFSAHIVDEKKFDASNYIANERQQFLNIAVASTADSMVTPCYVFEEDAWAFDWPERVLLAAKLHSAIANSTTNKVLDPMLIGRTLGEGRRSISIDEITHLASKAKIPSYITCRVGHNFGRDTDGSVKNRVFTVEFSRFELDTTTGAYSEIEKSRTERLSFDERKLPHNVIENYLTDIADELNIELSSSQLAASEDSVPKDNPDSKAIPTSLAILLQDKSGYNLWHAALLSALVPPLNDNATFRVAIPFLLAAEALPLNQPHRNLFIARGLKQLGRREAALELLAGDSTAEARAMTAALNGNLPTILIEIESVESGIPRVLALIDLLDLQTSYNIPSGQRQILITEITKLDTLVSDLIGQRLGSLDPWKLSDSTLVKIALDKTFPLKGESFEELIEQKLVLNDTEYNPFEFELATLRHTSLLQAQDQSTWCCGDSNNVESKRQIINLFDAIGEQMIFDRLVRTITYQGSPSRAQKLLDAVSEYFEGHPEFSRLKAATLISLAEAEKDQRRQQLLKLAADEILNAVLWSDGQTRSSANALQLGTWTKGLPRIFPDTKLHDSLSFDFPTRPYWPHWSHGGGRAALNRNLQNAIRNATHEFEPVRQLVHRISKIESPELAMTYIKELGNRFAGSQLLKETQLEISQLTGDEEATLKLILGEVEQGSTNEDIYTEYVETQVRNGMYDDAHKVGLLYPGFKTPDNFSRVTLSNTASTMGSAFYWRGIEKPAREFYSMAIKFGSGSGGDISSAQRLASLDKNFEEAAAIALRRANRYRSAYAYRDYMCYLFVLGYSSEAWTAFNALMPSMGRAQIWAAGDTGHRITGSSKEDVVSWLTSDAAKQAKNGLEPAAVIAAIRYFTTDREFEDEQIELITELIRGHNTRTTLSKEFTVRPTLGRENSQSDEILGPSFYNGHSKNLSIVTSFTYIGYDPKPTPGEPRTQIDSEYAFFSKGYRYWKHGELAKAAIVFEDMASYYEIANPRTLWMLPYFASSIATTENRNELAKYLDEFKHKDRRFDWHLSKAAVSVAENDMETAIEHFDRALDSRPHTEDRGMFAPYQWAELCEFYYTTTKEERFRERLLDWAIKVQHVMPFKAWPYLIEAQYTENDQRKKEALARGIYLDKNSTRLQKFDESFRKKASNLIIDEFKTSEDLGKSNEA